MTILRKLFHRESVRPAEQSDLSESLEAGIKTLNKKLICVSFGSIERNPNGLIYSMSDILSRDSGLEAYRGRNLSAINDLVGLESNERTPKMIVMSDSEKISWISQLYYFLKDERDEIRTISLDTELTPEQVYNKIGNTLGLSKFGVYVPSIYIPFIYHDDGILEGIRKRIHKLLYEE